MAAGRAGGELGSDPPMRSRLLDNVITKKRFSDSCGESIKLTQHFVEDENEQRCLNYSDPPVDDSPWHI